MTKNTDQKRKVSLYADKGARFVAVVEIPFRTDADMPGTVVWDRRAFTTDVKTKGRVPNEPWTYFETAGKAAFSETTPRQAAQWNMDGSMRKPIRKKAKKT